MKRHLIIPDRQAKPGVPLHHNRWIGAAIRDYEPDEVIDVGDNVDFESISSYASAKDREGLRLLADFRTANRAEELLREGLGGYKPKRRWRHRGNHEWRLERFLADHPVLEGMFSLDMLDDDGWKVIPYCGSSPGVNVLDGVSYAHYFANPNTGKPIAGTIANRLAKIGTTFVQGHVQGLLQGNIQYATGIVRHGIVAGSCYAHDEGFKGLANAHWRGIVVLNEVKDGQFCEMPLSLDYLCRRYEGMSLARFLQRNVRGAKERFSLARAA